MKSKKFLSVVALTVLMVGTHSALAVPGNTSDIKPEVIKSQQKYSSEAPEIVDMDADDCVATIESSTKTELGQSFTASFTTTKTTYSAATGLLFAIDDPDFKTDDEVPTTATVRFTVDPILTDVRLEYSLFDSLDKIGDREAIGATANLEVGKFLAIKVKREQVSLGKDEVQLVYSGKGLEYNEEQEVFYIELKKAGNYDVAVSPTKVVSDETKGVVQFVIDPSFENLKFEFAQFDTLETIAEQTPVEDVTKLDVGKYIAITVKQEGSETPLTNKDIYLMDSKVKGNHKFTASYYEETKQFYFEIKNPSKNNKIYQVKVVPVYDALLDSFPAPNVIRNEEVFVPSTTKFGSHFGMNVLGIKEGAMDFSVKNLSEKVKRLYIPDTIEEIGDNAIINTKDLEIWCEADKAPEGWSKHWTDCKNVKWGQDSVKVNSKDMTVANFFQNVATDKDLNQGLTGLSGKPGEKTFYIGTEDVAMLLHYTVVKTSGDREERIFEVHNESENTTYDSVGKDLGKTTFTKHIDVPLASDESIDPTSIYFTNIYAAKHKEGGVGYEIDMSTNYKLTPKYNGKVVELKQFVDFSFDKISNFNGFVSLEFQANVTKNEKGETAYPELMHFMYEKNKDKINSGKYELRFRVGSLEQTYVVVNYKVGDELRTAKLQLKSVKPTFELDINKPTNVVFLFDNNEFKDADFDIKNIEAIYLEGLTIKADILNKDSGKSISKSEFRARFGTTNIYDSREDKLRTMNINLIMILTVVVFTLVYLGISVAYFFYKKKAFKNDEFKRLNPKSFIKNATMGYLALQIMILDAFVIFIRATVMNNSTAIYNPLDAFIIVFSVLSILLIGYFIRFYMILGKAYLTKRKVDKLKLNEDSDDDGTK